jgi:hypothetical protein
MNLLLEQRTPSIVTQHDMNENSSALILKLKRQQTSKQQENQPQLGNMANEDQTLNANRTNNGRLKRNVANPSRRPSSPAFNGKQAANKRSVIIDNNNNDLSNNSDESSATKRFKCDETNVVIDRSTEIDGN